MNNSIEEETKTRMAEILEVFRQSEAWTILKQAVEARKAVLISMLVTMADRGVKESLSLEEIGRRTCEAGMQLRETGWLLEDFIPSKLKWLDARRAAAKAEDQIEE